MPIRLIDCANYESKSVSLRIADGGLCLARIALGKELKPVAIINETGIAIEFKEDSRAHNIFVRVISGFIAFTILLPITFVAFLIKGCLIKTQSKEIYNFFVKNLNGSELHSHEEIQKRIPEAKKTPPPMNPSLLREIGSAGFQTLEAPIQEPQPPVELNKDSHSSRTDSPKMERYAVRFCRPISIPSIKRTCSEPFSPKASSAPKMHNQTEILHTAEISLPVSEQAKVNTVSMDVPSSQQSVPIADFEIQAKGDGLAADSGNSINANDATAAPSVPDVSDVIAEAQKVEMSKIRICSPISSSQGAGSETCRSRSDRVETRMPVPENPPIKQAFIDSHAGQNSAPSDDDAKISDLDEEEITAPCSSSSGGGSVSGGGGGEPVQGSMSSVLGLEVSLACPNNKVVNYFEEIKRANANHVYKESSCSFSIKPFGYSYQPNPPEELLMPKDVIPRSKACEEMLARSSKKQISFSGSIKRHKFYRLVQDGYGTGKGSLGSKSNFRAMVNNLLNKLSKEEINEFKAAIFADFKKLDASCNINGAPASSPEALFDYFMINPHCPQLSSLASLMRSKQTHNIYIPKQPLGIDINIHTPRLKIPTRGPALPILSAELRKMREGSNLVNSSLKAD